MKKLLFFATIILTLVTSCACRRNENPFYVMSDEQKQVKDIVEDVQNIKEYAVEQQIKEMNSLEEKR